MISRKDEFMSKYDIKYTLLPGVLVSIKVEHNICWALNIVIQSTEEYIDLPFTPDMVNMHLMIGSNVIIKYGSECFEYIVSGSISDITLGTLPQFRVKISHINEAFNQRAFPRQDIHLPVHVLNENCDSIYGVTSNLSLCGVCFCTNKLLNRDEVYDICLNTFTDGPIYFSGNIVRSGQIGSLLMYSIQINCMDDDNSNKLSCFLFSLNKSFDNLRSQYLL